MGEDVNTTGERKANQQLNQNRAKEALRDFVSDMSSVVSRSDISKQEKKNQISVIGLTLYDELPESLQLIELAWVAGVHHKTIYGWINQGLVSPVQEENRPILQGQSFVAKPAEPLKTPKLFNKDQIMKSILLAAHAKDPEFKKTDIKNVYKDPDWSANPTNLEWIAHFLVNKSTQKDYYKP